MQDNNQNNWKSLLENPKSFAGETIRDKHETWEKLYARLHKKPRRILGAWYWAAAALLVMMICSIVFFINREKYPEAFVGVPSRVKEQIPIITQRQLNDEQKNTEHVLSQPKQKTNTALSIQKNAIVKTNPSTNKNFITDPVIGQLPQIASTPNIRIDSVIEIITDVPPVKKKLRVVHLNEIGQPTPEPTVNNRFTERHGFDLRIINGERYNSVNSSSSNNGLILIRPRNTSN